MLTENETKYGKVLTQVKTLFNQQPDWVTLFRQALGTEGIVHKTFSDHNELSAFEKSEEYAEIQQMVAKLRAKNQNGSNETTRVITVRLPRSMHESLRAEAHAQQTSMNQLCISKLLLPIDAELVPSD